MQKALASSKTATPFHQIFLKGSFAACIWRQISGQSNFFEKNWLSYSTLTLGHTNCTTHNFAILWLCDFMAQQSLVPSLVQVFIFRQKIRIEVLSTTMDNVKDHDFRLSLRSSLEPRKMVHNLFSQDKHSKTKVPGTLIKILVQIRSVTVRMILI